MSTQSKTPEVEITLMVTHVFDFNKSDNNIFFVIYIQCYACYSICDK